MHVTLLVVVTSSLQAPEHVAALYVARTRAMGGGICWVVAPILVSSLSCAFAPLCGMGYCMMRYEVL
jgi:hypothetical protein